MGDKNQTMATGTLHHWGCWTRKYPDWMKKGAQQESASQDDKGKSSNKPGAADLICITPTSRCFIEVKQAIGSDSWSFDDWRENQREWAWKMERVFRARTYLFIELGEGRRGKGVRCFLIPASKMLDVIEDVEMLGQQSSLPLVLTKHHTKVMRAHDFSFANLFDLYEIFWKEGHYYLPQLHVFNQLEAPILIPAITQWEKASELLTDDEYYSWRAEAWKTIQEISE